MYFCLTASEPLDDTDNVASLKDHDPAADAAVENAHTMQPSVCSSFMVDGVDVVEEGRRMRSIEGGEFSVQLALIKVQSSLIRKRCLEDDLMAPGSAANAGDGDGSI